MSASERHAPATSNEAAAAAAAAAVAAANAMAAGDSAGAAAAFETASTAGVDNVPLEAVQEAAAGAGVPLEEDRGSVGRRLARTTSAGTHHSDHGGAGHGHAPPPWSRRKALFILIAATVLFALLAGAL